MNDLIDEVLIERHGVNFLVRILPDNTVDSDYFDSAPTSRAYWLGQWRFVQVEVQAYIDGRRFGPDEWLCGVAYGTSPDWEQVIDLDYIVDIHPVPYMIDGLMPELKRLAARIAQTFKLLEAA